MYCSTHPEGERLTLRLAGDWRAANVPQLEQAMAAVPLAGCRELLIATDTLGSLDISGAWVLRELLEKAHRENIATRFLQGQPEQLALVLETLREQTPQVRAAAMFKHHGLEVEPITALGRGTVHGWHHLLHGLDFTGRASLAIGRALVSLKRMHPISIARHVYDTGITAIPIVALIAFLISVIIAYMGAQQLLKFGAEIFVVDLVTVGVLREMGVLLTAIIVAGRSGSSYAAEIGAMRLNEEVDALQATGVNPIEVLIAPRVLGLVIALPLLTIVADAIGLAGGALLCRSLLDMPFLQYVDRMKEAIGPMTFWVGVIKAPVFAVLIATAGTYRGLQVRNSSRELGRLTTVAVVQSIFMVILADAVFAVIFMELDI
jgi:phospholipid/cholesterol/gamma-HCH transport system permease protein